MSYLEKKSIFFPLHVKSISPEIMGDFEKVQHWTRKFKNCQHNLFTGDKQEGHDGPGSLTRVIFPTIWILPSMLLLFQLVIPLVGASSESKGII